MDKDEINLSDHLGQKGKRFFGAPADLYRVWIRKRLGYIYLSKTRFLQ